MKFFQSKMSRLKRKLLLYFILISVVSISVSAEIIFEMGSHRFQHSILDNYNKQLAKQFQPREMSAILKNIDESYVFEPINNLRNRMILLLLVVSISIMAAFYLFTKDIVSPMDGMVEATKKIANGDLTISVPVMSEDEIGQVASLINDMNVNLQDMIMQIRQEINRHMEQIIKASFKISEIIRDDVTDKAIHEKKITARDFKNMIKFGKEVIGILENMSDELFALQKFVKMYKTYGHNTEILQSDIDRAFSRYSKGSAEDEGSVE